MRLGLIPTFEAESERLNVLCDPRCARRIRTCTSSREPRLADQESEGSSVASGIRISRILLLPRLFRSACRQPFSNEGLFEGCAFYDTVVCRVSFFEAKKLFFVAIFDAAESIS